MVLRQPQTDGALQRFHHHHHPADLRRKHHRGPWVPVQIGAALDGLAAEAGAGLIALASNPHGLAQLLDQDSSLTQTWAGAGNGGGNTIYRLREGIERFLITDINNPGGSAQAQSILPVMWDVICDEASHFNHVPGGSNVLFMDGHVEFMRWPGAQGPAGTWTNPETGGPLPVGTAFPMCAGGMIFHEASHVFGALLP